MPIVECVNIFKSYVAQEKPVLNGVSLEFNEGCFVSIMGRSGSGKSTLLRIMCSLLKPDSGEVVVAGYNLNKLSPKELSYFRSRVIGIVFQDGNLISDFTVEDNILAPLYIAGQKPDKEYFNRLLELTELKEHLKKFPHQLSGGQKQRTAVARAVIARPSVIFADEPTGSLDSQSEKGIIDLFQSLNTEFKTAIIQVTHSAVCAGAGLSVINIHDGKVLT
ncbi:MAG: ABC transporter ATP-binding protein [Firmicutes bacterium]|nr:ABC transporter ATP-binding protein [Bacillota bacterium]